MSAYTEAASYRFNTVTAGNRTASPTKGNHVASKNPVGKLAETALSTLKDPKGAAGKLVDQAKGTVALGRLVADTAGAVVGKAAGEATGRLRGKRGEKAPSGARPGAATHPRDLKAVPDVNEPARGGTADSPKRQGDVLSTPDTPVRKAAAQKAPATKPPAKAPAVKKATQDAPIAKKAAAKTTPAKKVAASPADVAEVVEAAVAEDPNKTAAKPAKKTTAKKAPAAKKALAKKAGPGGRLPAKRSQPKSAAELAGNEGEDVRTQAGTAAASEGSNPSTGDTSLTQPDTPPLANESVAKSIASQTEQLRKAAENDPE